MILRRAVYKKTVSCPVSRFNGLPEDRLATLLDANGFILAMQCFGGSEPICSIVRVHFGLRE